MNAKVGEHALRPELGGTCTAPYIDGKLLVEFMHLFDKQFERKRQRSRIRSLNKFKTTFFVDFFSVMALGGYNIEFDDEKRQAFNDGIQEVLSYLN